jgi:hypothetical protein
VISALSGEREFSGFGAADANMSALPGICHPHAPRPLATVKSLQTALRGFAQRVSDPHVDPNGGKKPDGLVGRRTVAAVNYAVPKYTTAPYPFNTGKLTHAQIVAFAPQLAALIDQTRGANVGRIKGMSTLTFEQVQAATPADLPADSQPGYTQSSSGGSPMPYGPAQPQYYPPGHAPSQGYPGYAPQRQANVSTSVYIPAQYDHISFNPMTVGLVLAVITGTVLMKNTAAKYKKVG